MAKPIGAEIMETAKELNPAMAYLVGFDEYAGRMFIPSEGNLKAALGRIRALRKRATAPMEKKILDSMETAILFDEPQPVLDDLIGAFFAHLVKEGVKDDHMLSLLKLAKKSIDASSARFAHREFTSAVKALTLYRLDGVVMVLETVKHETKNLQVKADCDAVEEKVKDYVRRFELEGWGRGEFPNVEKIFRETGFDLKRQKFYRVALSKGFDYSETPDELEKKAMAWLDEEVPLFRKATAKLAKKFDCEPVPELVEEKINSRMKLDPKKLVGVTMEIRDVIQRLTDEDVVGINPKYETRVIETPPYLTGTYPTGGAQFFNTYSKPFQVFFQTTDPKRDPDKSVASLINLLVHEEYGHCVHHSNSALGFVGKIPDFQLLPAPPTAGPITEGLSFNREIEFLEASKALEKKTRPSKAEKAYIKLLEKYGGLQDINLELEFMTRRWRIIRFLRVIGDVWVNSGKKTLLEFVDWGHERTGVPRASIYYQLFPAHEGMFPGYATAYAVVGQEIRGMERKIRDPKKKVKFSTYLTSIGFPPRSIYREMLQKQAAKLK